MDSYVLQKVKSCRERAARREPNHLYTNSASSRVLQEELFCANIRAETRNFPTGYFHPVFRRL